MFYYKVASKMIRVIGTIEKGIERVDKSLIVTEDNSHVNRIYELAHKIVGMGYDIDLVETEIGAGLKIYTSPDEVGEVLRTVRSVKQC